jgi:methionyl-tRNA formyltransferase
VRRLSDAGTLDLVAVVTQPDRAGHRGRVTAPPVKDRALALSIPVLQPARLDSASVGEIRGLEPQLLVWAAYGNKIPRALIDAVSGRAVNVHASLLPRWRGAAPIERSIIEGDWGTGLTLMEGTADLDKGPILARWRVGFRKGETKVELTHRLAELGGQLLERELPRYIAGELTGEPQDESHATIATKLTSRECELDFTKQAEELERRVRACSPDPGAFTTYRGQRLLVTRVAVTGGSPAEAGSLTLRNDAPHVAAGAGWLRLDEVRPAGKKTMTGAEWARGLRGAEGSRLPS